MKDITNTQTADLIAEWKYLLNKKNHASINWGLNDEKAQPIAAELDRRCEGFLSIGGKLEVGASQVSALQQLTSPPKPIGYRFKVPLAELRDRLTWLLLKEGGGK